MNTGTGPDLQYLLSLPPRMAAAFAALEGKNPPEWFATSDPPTGKLGSGGGTANVLAAAWRHTGQNRSFSDWLQSSRKLVIHAGGQSRRLPAYAPPGKLLMPIPVFRWSRGQRLDQTLLDLQLPDYRRVLAHAGPETVAMVASGDVLLRFARELPPFPAVDILGLGMWVKPELMKDFGVFITPREHPNELAFFEQKPSLARIRELSGEHLCLVDTGMWLFSERAVRVLMDRCGWKNDDFTGGRAGRYELYAQFGLALGRTPRQTDPAVNDLSCAVVPLPEAEFYHFGTSRQMIESISALQNRELDETKLGSLGAKRHPDQFLQNTRFEVPIGLEENHTLWVENSVIPKTWRLAHDHVLTGIPENDWDLHLPAGVCLDCVPVGDRDYCLRVYGVTDAFSGPVREAAWLGRPAGDWCRARELSWAKAGIDPATDIQEAPLFPVLDPADLNPRFIEWLVAEAPATLPDFAADWLAARRLSADQLARETNLERLYRQRARLREQCLLPMFTNSRWSVFFRLDLESTGRLYARTAHPLPEPAPEQTERLEPLHRVHDEMFRSAVRRHRAEPNWQAHETAAFARLQELIVRDAQLSPVEPRRDILEDQIVWARSPVRFDLGGGWTDTPPYCIEFGGQVVNVAADLNGQPPIQVFAKLGTRPQLVVRSIDLGVEQVIRTYDELDTYATPGSEFALAKAAFALAGFLPRFHARGGYHSLEEQLRAFGGGIELSLLSAVPKGSGLGTSSILAATLLATLGNLCGLNWDRNLLFIRTLAMEQMLTTGGGWQDQAGAIYRGIKLIETRPGLAQKPAVSWLPEHLFNRDYANKSILLYYTGITRLAKNILQEIVRGIFLNSPAHLDIIAEIGTNAQRARDAIQRCSLPALIDVIRASWRLNQALDAGTNPPEVQRILQRIHPWIDATKLLGAGGGGFLLIFAKDETAAACIRKELTLAPPNGRARFVDFSVSNTGLQLTRS